MNTSKRLELANLIALRLRGINIEDAIASQADGESHLDTAENSPGQHRNVGGLNRPQSDSESNSDSDGDNGGVAAAVHLPDRARFRPELVDKRDGDESSDDSSAGAASPLPQPGASVASVPAKLASKNFGRNDHDSSSGGDSDDAAGESEDSEDGPALQLQAHVHDRKSPAPRTAASSRDESQNSSPEKPLQPAVASPASSPSSEDSSPDVSCARVSPPSAAKPSDLSMEHASIADDGPDSAATSPQPCTPLPSEGDAAALSARLSQDREKEYEAKLIMQLSEDVTSKLVLNRGATFVKHGRSGDPHSRFVWVSSDFKRIHWGDADTRNSKFMRFDDVTDVQAGKNTAVFQRSYSSKFSSIPESMCFSVVSGARTLDLQVGCR